MLVEINDFVNWVRRRARAASAYHSDTGVLAMLAQHAAAFVATSA